MSISHLVGSIEQVEALQIYDAAQAAAFAGMWSGDFDYIRFEQIRLPASERDALGIDLVLRSSDGQHSFIVLAILISEGRVVLPAMLEGLGKGGIARIVDCVAREIAKAPKNLEVRPLHERSRLNQQEMAGERALPGMVDYATAVHHVKRYIFVLDRLLPGSLIECASGAGYGAAILARSPRLQSYLGVDLAADAINAARGNVCGDPRFSFVRCPLAQASNGQFDNVLSLETIEHTPNPAVFMRELIARMAPGGQLLLSLPTEPWGGSHLNDFHFSNWTRQRFERFAARFFESIEIFAQRLSLLGPTPLEASEIKATPHEVEADEMFVAVLRQPREIRVQTIVVKRRDALGDVIWITPVLRALRLRHPDCNLIVMTRQTEVFINNPDVDLVFNMAYQPDDDDQLIDLDLAYETRREQHLLAAYAEAAGVTLGDWRPALHPTVSTRAACAKLLREHFAPQGVTRLLAVHMAASSPDRIWSQEAWQRLLRGLLGADPQLGIVVLGHGKDFSFASLGIESPRVMCLARRLRLMQTAGVLACCDLLVAPDSGLLHVAAAMGTSYLGLFGMADPATRLPLDGASQAIWADIACRGCLQQLPPLAAPLCRLGKAECMDVIQPEDVLARSRAMLEALPAGRWLQRAALLAQEDRPLPSRWSAREVVADEPEAVPMKDEYAHWLRARHLSPAEERAVARALGARAADFELVLVCTPQDSASALGDTLASIGMLGGIVPRVRYLGESEHAASSGLTPVVCDAEGQMPWSEFAEERWLLCLRPGDRLEADALQRLALAIAAHPEAGLIYADEDALDATGQAAAPQFRPDFDIDHLRSLPYLGRFLLMRGRELRALGGCQTELGEAAFHDYALRFYERFGASAIHHQADLLFHARTPIAPIDAPFEDVLRAHLARSGIAAELMPGALSGSFSVRYAHAGQPLVSIIVPSYNQQALLSRCLESLSERTTYAHYEILVVDNGSDDAESRAYLQGLVDLQLPQLRVLSYDAAFSFAAMVNLGAREARGDYLVLLNNDCAILRGDWLEALLNHAQRPEVGVVGAKLLLPDGRVQHAGVVMGLQGPADHVFYGESLDAPGYGGRLQIDQQYSAVSAACMMIRKTVFDALGGFDAEALGVAYGDFDFCLRVRKAGHAVVWTPACVVLHNGGATLRSEQGTRAETRLAKVAAERAVMYQRWLPVMAQDPFYNRNLSLRSGGFRLEAYPAFRPGVPGLRKLISHCADLYGCGLYRTIGPTEALIESGLAAGACAGDYFSPQDIRRIAPDVIVLQRQTSDEQIERIQGYRDHSGAKLIYELDDYLLNLPMASIHKGQFPKDITRRMRTVMSLCDRVVVSTEPLRQALAAFHDEIVVLPNYMPARFWRDAGKRTRPDTRRKPRVGWAGGSSHSGDLAVIIDVVRALADRVDWVFFGMMPKGVGSFVKEFHPGVPMGEYPAKLASLDLDLALAPLEDNQFNACKSNLRLLEFGICGYPVIATDIEPYRCGFPVTLVRNRFKDWVDAIEARLADRDALWEDGRALQDFVRSEWMLEGENLRRWQKGWMLEA